MSPLPQLAKLVGQIEVQQFVRQMREPVQGRSRFERLVHSAFFATIAPPRHVEKYTSSYDIYRCEQCLIGGKKHQVCSFHELVRSAPSPTRSSNERPSARRSGYLISISGSSAIQKLSRNGLRGSWPDRYGVGLSEALQTIADWITGQSERNRDSERGGVSKRAVSLIEASAGKTRRDLSHSKRSC